MQWRDVCKRQIAIGLRMDTMSKEKETVIIYFFLRNLTANRKRQIKLQIEEDAGLREVGFVCFLVLFVLFFVLDEPCIFMVCWEGVSGEANYILFNVVFSAFPNP